MHKESRSCPNGRLRLYAYVCLGYLQILLATLVVPSV